MTRFGRRRLLRTGLALAGWGLAGGCGLAPLAAPTPAKRGVRVAYLGPVGSNGTVERLRLALGERGYVQGEQFSLEARFTSGGPQEAAAAAAELLAAPLDVLVANGNGQAQAVKDRSATIPIVLSTGSDPIRSGLAASLARPGGNVTGVTAISAELSAKRLALLKEAIPGLQRIGALWNSENPTKRDEWDETQRAAPLVGVQAFSLGLRSAEDLAAAADTVRREALQGLVVFADALTSAIAPQTGSLVSSQRLPMMSEFRAWVDAGGLMSYGPSPNWQVARVADFVDRILKGARPADLPIEQPTTFDFLINLRAADALGLTIPPMILAQATEVLR